MKKITQMRLSVELFTCLEAFSTQKRYIFLKVYVMKVDPIIFTGRRTSESRDSLVSYFFWTSKLTLPLITF